MHKTHNILQQPLHANMCREIPGTGVSMHILLKLTHTYKSKKYLGNGCVSSSKYLQQKPGLEITVLEGMLKF